MSTIKPTSVPSKKLSRSITSSSSSFKVNNIKSWARNSLGVNINLASTDFGGRAFCVFRNDTGTKIEIMEFDPTTIASSDITILKRGLGFDGDLTTETTAYKLDWSANETTVNFGTDVPQLLHFLGRQQIIYKTATETVNNSSTLQDDDALVFPVLANEVWKFTMFLFYQSGTTPDLKVGFTYPSGATMYWKSDDAPQTANIETGTETLSGAGASTTSIVGINGIVYVSSTAGNIQMQWAQNTLNASDSKVLLGSHIIATRLSP